NRTNAPDPRASRRHRPSAARRSRIRWAEGILGAGVRAPGVACGAAGSRASGAPRGNGLGVAAAGRSRGVDPRVARAPRGRATVSAKVSGLATQLRAAGLDWVVPDWAPPKGVHAFFTTRNGGPGGADSLDLGPGDIGSAPPATRAAIAGNR